MSKRPQTQTQKEEDEIVDISSLKSEMLKQRLNVSYLLKELVGKEVIIKDYNATDNTIWAEVDGRDVSVAVGSRVAQKKLLALAKVLKEGKKVRARVVERKSKTGNTYIDLE